MSRTVAIVDDDRAIRVGLSSLMRSAGFSVRLFDSGEELLAMGLDSPPACVLTDVQMPGLDGLELQEQLRRRFPELPILIMTAFPTVAIREKAIADGRSAFVPKPFDAEVILAFVERATLGSSESS